MRLSARDPKMYLGRTVSSGVMLLVGVGFVIAYNQAGRNATQVMFALMGFLLLQVCLFGGAQATADSISKEKREGTVGLLLLTSLSPFQIVVGKLVANTIRLFYDLMVALPVLSMMVLLGGVDGMTLLTMGVVLLNTVFVCAAFGLWASSVEKERTRASTKAVMLVLTFWILLPSVAAICQRYFGPSFVLQLLSLFSFSGALTMGGPMAVFGFQILGSKSQWLAVLAMHLVGWFCIWLAVRGLRKTWQDAPASAKPSLKERLRAMSFGNPRVRQAHRARLLAINPFYWLASRDLHRRLKAWVVTLSFMLFVVFMPGGGPLVIWHFLTMVVMLSFFSQMTFSSNAAAQLSQEYEQGTLEMLLATPLSPREIIQGQLAALRDTFGGQVLMIAALGVAVGSWGTIELYYRGAAEYPMFAFGTVCLVINYVLSMRAYAWLGMWCVTISADPKKAHGQAVVRGFLIPLMGVTALILAEVAFKLVTGSRRELMDGSGTLFAWLILSTVNALYWVRKVKRELPDRIRLFAAKRYEPAPVDPGLAGRMSALLELLKQLRKRPQPL